MGELAKLEEDLVTGKAEHGKLAAQAQELRDKRLFEESRLRARGLELHSRVLQVSQENNRLEVLRRDEDLQISRNQETILELTRIEETLRARKQYLDSLDGLDYDEADGGGPNFEDTSRKNSDSSEVAFKPGRPDRPVSKE